MFQWLEKLILKRIIKRVSKKIEILKLTALENYEERKDELLDKCTEKVEAKIRETIEEFLDSKIGGKTKAWWRLGIQDILEVLILATGLLVVQILGGKFPLAVCEKEVIMILYKPKERTEPYKTDEQIKDLYLKYRDILENPIQKKRGFIWKIKKLFGVINQN